MAIRTYLFIGLVVGGIVFLISTFFGEGLATWSREQQFQAAIRGQDVLEVLVFEPVIFVMTVRPWGPLLAGLLWPAVFIWAFLILLAVILIAVLDVTRDIEAVTWLLHYAALI